MSILAALNAKTLELRKARDPLAGAFQGVQALATANAKERTLVEFNKTQAKASEAERTTVDFSTVKANDEDALKAIQKAVKQVKDTLALKPDHQQSIDELATLEALLPRMASEDEIQGEAESFLRTMPEAGMKQMGVAMAHLQTVFGTSLDKSKASGVLKGLLSAR